MGSMIVLALIIILVSGLIAYVGDLVGRKMGRKRLTLLGLRPRHTAIVISIGVGMLIASLTLVAMLAINRSIRMAFFSLDQVRNDLQQSKSELTNARHQTAQAREQLQTQTQDLQASQKQRDAAKQQREEAEQRLKIKRGDLARANRDVQDSQRRLGETQGKLKDVRGQLESSVTKLTKQTQKLARVEQQLSLLEEYANNVNGYVSNMIFSPLSFSYGQEILSGLIPTSGSEMSRKVYLDKFFATAERIVRQRSVDLPKEAVAITFLTVEKNEIKPLSKREAIDLLLKRIDKLAARDGVVIRIASIRNVPLNGSALIPVEGVQLVPNALAYKAGDPVAKVDLTINGSTPLADIVGSLADDLLRRELPKALRAKGMVPISLRFDLAHPENTPEAYTPMVSWADLMAAVEKAKGMRGTISLVARSHADVTCYGPLNIDIDVVPAQ